MLFGKNVLNDRPAYNKALLSDNFSAALQICRRARRYALPHI
jgi:hypothetical protein